MAEHVYCQRVVTQAADTEGPLPMVSGWCSCMFRPKSPEAIEIDKPKPVSNWTDVSALWALLPSIKPARVVLTSPPGHLRQQVALHAPTR